jgi:hypothetical protein
MTTTISRRNRLEDISRRFDAQVADIRRHLDGIGGTKPGPSGISVTGTIATALRMVAGAPAETRALADVVGTPTGNAEGLVYNVFVSELLGRVDRLRPLFASAGTVAFPTTGYGLAFPRRTQSTLVAKRTAEKSEVASRELTVASASYNMEWFAGGVDVSLELILQSDMSVLEVIAADLLDQYAQVTETEFAADTVAAATAEGAALPTGTWGAMVSKVVETSAQIRAATGAAGDRLALKTATWQAVLGLTNPSAPAVSPGVGPALTSESLNIGGVIAFHAPEATADVQFNEIALRKAERPPATVTADNPALMGRDIGILGATIFLPLYPAGIVKYTA